ncbi:MAG: hypothetical protein GX237_00655 [Clostridiales bacterium]|nr:hypothetical protein [Clostridiales bacterium]
MSNIIKAYAIQYKSDNKVTIDYKDKDEEIQSKLLSKVPQGFIEEGFNQGIEAEVVEVLPTQEEEMERAEAIIDKAKKEAESILEEAENEANRLKEDALRKANQQGYEEGLEKGRQEIEQIKSKLEDKQRQLEEEYKSLLAGMEDQVSEIIASLITKLTGILVDDKMDIINYLVEKALFGNDNLDNYLIRVSHEDIDTLTLKKEDIEEIVGKEVQIIADSKLTKNQCLIETESKVIDCSLDVQLSKLITDLRMISSI